MRDEIKPEGVFVINDQIFSVTDLLSLMQRHGIRVKLNRDGLMIDGEYISSVANLDENRCPLATSCEKRVALVDFLKLQKSNTSYRPTNNSPVRDYDAPQAYPTMSQNSDYLERREEPRRDFIKANNHDLFDGNINNSNAGLFDEPEEPTRGLFDEPDMFSTPEVSRGNQNQDNQYFGNNDFGETRSLPQDRSYSNDNQDYSVQNKSQIQPYCSECGFDLNPTWNSCPNCGNKVFRGNSSGNDKLFF